MRLFLFFKRQTKYTVHLRITFSLGSSSKSSQNFILARKFNIYKSCSHLPSALLGHWPCRTEASIKCLTHWHEYPETATLSPCSGTISCSTSIKLRPSLLARQEQATMFSKVLLGPWAHHTKSSGEHLTSQGELPKSHLHIPLLWYHLQSFHFAELQKSLIASKSQPILFPSAFIGLWTHSIEVAQESLVGWEK